MAKHLNIRVYGQVQGVFFRVSAIEKAKDLGLHGFVRNDPDGTVYIEAEGDEEALSLYLAWCRQGPAAAKVDRVEVEDGSWVGFGDFRKVRKYF